MPTLAKSVFGPGPRQKLDAAERARFKNQVDAHWRNKGQAPIELRLTNCGRLVALALLRHLGIDGRCDPSRETLALECNCSVSTVQRALDVLRGLGLIYWQRRIVRTGRDVAQTSSAYVLTPASAIDTAIVAAMPRAPKPVVDPEVHFELQSLNKDSYLSYCPGCTSHRARVLAAFGWGSDALEKVSLSEERVHSSDKLPSRLHVNVDQTGPGQYTHAPGGILGRYANEVHGHGRAP